MGAMLQQYWPVVAVALAILAARQMTRTRARKEFERIFHFSPAPITEPGIRENYYVLGMLESLETEAKRAQAKLEGPIHLDGPYTREDYVEHWELNRKYAGEKLTKARKLAKRFRYAVPSEQGSNPGDAVVA